MAPLVDAPYKYDFEILAQTLFIYAHRFINTQAELDNFYKYAALISRPIYNEISAMHVSNEAAQPVSTRIWPIGIVTLYGLTVMSLPVGILGLLVASYIVMTSPGNVVAPVLATTYAVIVIIGCHLQPGPILPAAHLTGRWPYPSACAIPIQRCKKRRLQPYLMPSPYQWHPARQHYRSR